jgi:hypothetical protein
VSRSGSLSVVGVVVVRVVMGGVVMMARTGSEGRAGEHHHEQSGENKLLHIGNRSTVPIVRNPDFRGRCKGAESKVERGAGGRTVREPAGAWQFGNLVRTAISEALEAGPFREFESADVQTKLDWSYDDQ